MSPNRVYPMAYSDTALQEWLLDFERGLDTRRIEASRVPAHVLGFGEISVVLDAPGAPGLNGRVLKRLPIFRSVEESRRHEELCERYVRLITDDVGIDVPRTSYVSIPVRDDLVVFYAVQDQLPKRLLGHHLIHWARTDQVLLFFDRMLRETGKLWAYNRDNEDRIQVTLDIQLSNWAIQADDSDHPEFSSNSKLAYLDITTPLFRVDLREQLESKYALRGCPSFLRGILERYMAADVINRYYDTRKSVIDVLANCIKEGREDLIPPMIDVVNRFFNERPSGLEVEPIRMKEVYQYYRSDAFIWSLYLALKKLDRFIKLSLAGKPYDFILPEKVPRNFPLRNRPRKT